MFLQMYKLDCACFLTVPGLAWQAALKKTKVKLDLLTDTDISSMVEKVVRGGISHVIYRFVKADHKHMNHHILSIRTQIITMDEQCLKSHL